MKYNRRHCWTNVFGDIMVNPIDSTRKLGMVFHKDININLCITGYYHYISSIRRQKIINKKAMIVSKCLSFMKPICDILREAITLSPLKVYYPNKYIIQQGPKKLCWLINLINCNIVCQIMERMWMFLNII